MVSMMVAYLGDQVTKFNPLVIVSLVLTALLTIVVFNWFAFKRFYLTFPRDMR